MSPRVTPSLASLFFDSTRFRASSRTKALLCLSLTSSGRLLCSSIQGNILFGTHLDALTTKRRPLLTVPLIPRCL